MSGATRSWIEAYERAVAEILDGSTNWSAELHTVNGEGPLLRESLQRLADHVSRQQEQRDKLWGAVERVGRGVARETVLDDIFRSFRELIDFDRLAYAQISREGAAVETVWVHAEGTSDEGVGYRAPLGAGSLRDVLGQGTPRVITDLPRYLEQHPQSQSTRRMLEFGIRSSLTCPLVTADGPVGFLFFSSARPRAFDEQSAAVLRPLLVPVAHALEKSELYRELHEMREALTAANMRLSSMARSDALTGIANRRHFDEALEAEVARAKRFGSPLSLLMADIDFFKTFNDMRGHHLGDDALRLVASTLVREVRRDGDLAARYGGEEFAVILPQTDLEAAAHVARRIVRSTAELGIPHPGSTYDIVTISIGVSTLRPSASGDALSLVASADGALYRAKANGRNTVHADTEGGLRPLTTGPHLLGR